MKKHHKKDIFKCSGIQENLYALSEWELQNEIRQHNKQQGRVR